MRTRKTVGCAWPWRGRRSFSCRTACRQRAARLRPACRCSREMRGDAAKEEGCTNTLPAIVIGGKGWAHSELLAGVDAIRYLAITRLHVTQQACRNKKHTQAESLTGALQMSLTRCTSARSKRTLPEQTENAGQPGRTGPVATYACRWQEGIAGLSTVYFTACDDKAGCMKGLGQGTCTPGPKPLMLCGPRQGNRAAARQHARAPLPSPPLATMLHVYDYSCCKTASWRLPALPQRMLGDM